MGELDLGAANLAKRHSITQISASFHYLVKRSIRGEAEAEDIGFTDNEFRRIVERIQDTSAINFNDDHEVTRIKAGENIPFIDYEQLSESTHFGCFEGAYYGQEYRNTRLGTIDAESLNLRRFHYLLDHRRDGKIVVGVQYTGNYGDYDGIRRCFQHLLRGNAHKVISRTFSSMRHEIGDGDPIELKINIRRQNNIAGGPALFSRNGVFAIRRADYGEDFADDVRNALGIVRGNAADRKTALARLINNGELLEIDDDDIEGCSLLMRQNGRQHTIYLLGDSNFATKFPLNVRVHGNGIPEPQEVKTEMLRVLRDIVTPGLRQ